MADAVGKCPNCDKEGEVGRPCTERVCQKRGYCHIPAERWERLHDGPEKLPDPLVGTAIGDFLIVDLIGVGGFGRVYLALQAPLYRLRGALKLLNFPTDNAAFAEALPAKFKGEAEALADLTHPNIVRLLKYGLHGDKPYLVMEFVSEGTTLRDEIYRRAKRDAGFDGHELRHIFGQILNGLEAAHAQAIIHRDLKPENIMLQAVVGNPTYVRIFDFGMAKIAESGTSTKWPLGSPSYMAPEQVRMSNLGPWTDLYALGVIAFELVTGQKPFGGGGDNEIVARKLDPDFNPFDALDAPLPTPVANFLAKALAPAPKNRFRSVVEFRDGLRVALETLDEATGPGELAGAKLTHLLDEADLLEVEAAPAEDDHARQGQPSPPPTPEGGPAEAGSVHEPTAHVATSAAAQLPAVRRTSPGVETTEIGRGRTGDIGGRVGAAIAVAGLALVVLAGLLFLVVDDEPGRPQEASAAESAPGADPAGEAPAGEAPAGEAPAGEAPAGEAGAGEPAVAMDFDPPAAGAADLPTALALGKYHSCLLDEAGKVRCWGGNMDGELGLGHTRPIGDDEPISSVEPLSFDRPVAQVVAAGDRQASFTCVRFGDGGVRCFGANAHGQLGLGHTRAIGDDEPLASLSDLSLGQRVSQLAAGASKFGSHVCALLDDGAIRCWGSGKFGKLGYAHENVIGDDELAASAGLVDVGGPARRIWAGKYNTCAELDDGGLRCWGWNEFGQLGLGHTGDIGDDEIPATQPVVPLDGRVARLSIGRRHICAVLDDGRLHCWGWNAFGQLGLGHREAVGDDEVASAAGPVELSGRAVDVAAGANHTCALLDDGRVQCWGAANFGQTGYGHERTIGDDERPASVGTVHLGAPATALAAGSYHTCAVLDDGRLRCWGFNDQGQLGYGYAHHIGDDEPPASVAPLSFD